MYIVCMHIYSIISVTEIRSYDCKDVINYYYYYYYYYYYCCYCFNWLTDNRFNKLSFTVASVVNESVMRWSNTVNSATNLVC